MDIYNSYGFIIAACLIIIISYFFNKIAIRTSIPSVLLLIILGIGLNQLNRLFSFVPDLNLMPILEVLGIVGLIMIVLEASLELKLGKAKIGVIWRSLVIALILLGLNIFVIAWVIKALWSLDWYIASLYAIPLSIISSAIIIPSVQMLPEKKKEFLIYESTFSDILGIMIFYFVIQAGEESGQSLAWSITGSILLTIAVSIVAGYGLLFLFQKIQGGTKLFLLIAVLVLLYSAGKLFHLSSLLLILVFGLILSNSDIFTGGKLRRYFDQEAIKKIYSDFLLITVESSFIVRTFFFLVFGLTITLGAIADSKVVLASLIILVLIFLSRYFLLTMFFKKSAYPQWQIAPRGLITILLFFGIPEEYHIEDFASFEGVLLLVIIVSSGVMAWSMISFKKRRQNPDDLDLEIETIEDNESIEKLNDISEGEDTE